MRKLALAVLLLMSHSAQATCLLGAVSGSIPWDAASCPTDPNMQSDNYSVTLTGPTTLLPPANMPPTGDKFVTLWVNYAPGGSLKLGTGFVGEDPVPLNGQPQFCNKPGCSDEIVCHVHAVTNLLGQGPFCGFHMNIHPIGPAPAPPAPTGNVARGSGTKITMPLTAVPGSTVLCGALTGKTASMTVSDDAGDKFTGFDASRTNTQHPIQMFKAEKITGSPANFILTVPTSDTLVLRCDVLAGGSVAGSAGFTNQTAALAGANAIKSNSLTAAAGDVLYALALCSCGPIPSIAAGTGYSLAQPPDLATGAGSPMNAEYATALAGSTIATFTNSNAGDNWNTDLVRLGQYEQDRCRDARDYLRSPCFWRWAARRWRCSAARRA